MKFVTRSYNRDSQPLVATLSTPGRWACAPQAHQYRRAAILPLPWPRTQEKTRNARESDPILLFLVLVFLALPPRAGPTTRRHSAPSDVGALLLAAGLVVVAAFFFLIHILRPVGRNYAKLLKA